MHRIAYGYLDPPPHPLPDQPGFRNVRKQFAALFLLFLAAGLAGKLLHSPSITLILIAAGVLLLPAVYMIVVVTDSLLSAIDPSFLLRVAFGIGWPYLLLWVLLLLIGGGSGQLQALVKHSTASLPLAMGMSGLFSMYFGLVMMALMGYVAYQHHELFGHQVRDPALEGADGKALRKLEPPDRAELLFGLGKIEEAQSDLEQRLRRQPDDLALNERYHRLLVARRDAARAAAHADFFIGRLMFAKRDEQAWRVYAEHLAQFGPLQVKDADDCVRLARQARNQRQGKQALPLLDKFAQRHPNHPAIPEAWLLSAQILAEDLHEDAKAQMIVSALLKRYPDHPVKEQAERYAATLARLAGAKQRAGAGR
jgi:tetratricopeptide (TPR) repeat protein